MKTTAEIRQAFLDFFEARDHRVVPSSPLVPANDPTLLFTNAGMVQFKDVFLGAEKRNYARAASSQRCVRAGGKHNDLENVGYTARHHTFFEMLGNFSFGDYFKREAITYAWEFLTGVCGLPADKLWVTVFEEDDEAAEIWLDEIGVDPERISRIGAADNFWAMGDTGPCGPCSEIFYDHGPDVPGGPPGSPDEDGDRYIEVWNLVFMQFDQAADGTRTPLPKPCVDTGMGLERLAAILQGVHSNYDIDLFVKLIDAAATATGTDNRDDPSLKVIADHIRACAFLITDGVMPSNEGRGYVLRRIIRRAIRHGYKLGCRDPFFAAMVDPLVAEMGEAYPELGASSEFVVRVLHQEEEKFQQTLANGMVLLGKYLDSAYPFLEMLRKEKDWGTYAIPEHGPLESLDGTNDPMHPTIGILVLNQSPSINRFRNVLQDIAQEKECGRTRISKIIALVPKDQEDVKQSISQFNARELGIELEIREFDQSEIDRYRVLPGAEAFKLYDTFGFPLDLTADVCREKGFRVDQAAFEAKMEAQRERARAAGKFGARDGLPAEVAAKLPETEFLGYEQTQADGVQVAAILVDGKPVEQLTGDHEAVVILDRTPFYAEAGGQVGDTGTLSVNGTTFRVDDTRKLGGAYTGHFGRLQSGTLKPGMEVHAAIDAQRRADIVQHHSATHLLHSALRTVLGTHVQQKGSLVAPDRTRFDFSHPEPLTDEQIAEIEHLVNREIQANADAEVMHMGYDEAMKAGALAFFGDKYGDEVRVLRFGDFSTELCGGTHVHRVGDIGVFKIVSETGISAGVRRIEAVAGRQAVAWMQDLDRSVRRASGKLKTRPEELDERIDHLLTRSRELEKELERLKGKLASASGSDLAGQAREIAGVKVIAADLDGVDPGGLRDTADQLKNKLGSGIVVLGTTAGDGVRLVAGVTKDLTDRFKAGELVNHVAARVGGKGGGRPDFAQAGGSEPDKLAEALASVEDWVRERAG